MDQLADHRGLLILRRRDRLRSHQRSPAVASRPASFHPLGARGIDSKPYLPAIHLMSFYRERFGHREGEFPVAEDVARRSLALPFFPEMTESEVEQVSVALREALAEARQPASSFT